MERREELGWVVLTLFQADRRQHTLAYLLTHSLENEAERVEKPHDGKPTIEGVSLKLKLCFLINSCITASCLPQESNHTRESGTLYTVDLWYSQMVCVCVSVRMSVDWFGILFVFVCLRSFVSHRHTSMNSVCVDVSVCLWMLARSSQARGILKRIWSYSLLLTSPGDWTQSPAKPAETDMEVQ